MEIIKVGIESIPIIQQISYITWPVAYKEILSEEQLQYMLGLIYSNAALEKQFNELNHNFIIALRNKEAIAFASYSQKIKSDHSTYRLHKIYVLPGLQGRGVGKCIINFIIENIKPLGASTLELNVNRFNRAKEFYERLNFKIIKEEDIDIGNGFLMEDYVMELSLVSD